MFFIGNSFFKKNWVVAPASTSARDGLGPHFDSRSCSGCHFMDGRGNPTTNPASLVIRIASLNHDQPSPVPRYGKQLTRHAINNFQPEGNISVSQVSSNLPGIDVPLTENQIKIEWLKGTPQQTVIISPRVAPHLIGLGLLEAIDTEKILLKHDPDDLNNDGISGRANWVQTKGQQPVLGRFGWQAESPSVAFQVGKALINDMGITNDIFGDNICLDLQEHPQCQSSSEPEISSHLFNQLVLYSKALAIPRIRASDAAFESGLALFEQTGCDSCHTPFHETTGKDKAFANKTIAPFTDLLLHDMGEYLADKDSNGNPQKTEWRTPPLWGIGLFQAVNKHTQFLHDGRANSIHEAILWHGGEAHTAREKYLELSDQDMQQLLEFLNEI